MQTAMPRVRKTEPERFLGLVNVGPSDQCWTWKRKTKGRYPIFKQSDGKSAAANRVSYRLFRGDPGVLCVLHKCDNTQCVNPGHLFLGTHKDNMDDMRRKGRWHPGVYPKNAKHARFFKGKFGDLNPNTKHPDELVRKLKSAHQRYKRTARQLAAEFGLGYQVVRNLIYIRAKHLS